jgi:NAD(P)-dependent dehydrogenase (short-subunit alcohol dehydrogenase family)
MPDRPLAGRVAIVTGAGRGLGRALAGALSEAGAAVCLSGRTRAPLEAAAAELRAAGGEALAVTADVTSEADVERLIATTLDRLGGLDVLVNNSGVLHSAAVAETSLADWERVIATNLTGPFLCCRAAAPHLLAQGHGKVVNIASMFGRHGVATLASYCASKAAVANLTASLALEWAPAGIQVNAIAPGYFESEINADLRADERAFARIVKRIPAGRMGQPNELGPLLVYLASSVSDFMTGETIVIDGGQTA